MAGQKPRTELRTFCLSSAFAASIAALDGGDVRVLGFHPADGPLRWQLAAGPITLTKAGPRALRPTRSGLKVTLRLTQPGSSPAPRASRCD